MWGVWGKRQKSLKCNNFHEYAYLIKKSFRFYYFVQFKMVQTFWEFLITTCQTGQELSSDIVRLIGYYSSYTACPVPKTASLHSLCQLRQAKWNGSFSLIHSSEKRAEVWKVSSMSFKNQTFTHWHFYRKKFPWT